MVIIILTVLEKTCDSIIIIERIWKYIVRTDDFYLLFQPIVNVETSKTKVAKVNEKVDEYEVLLRSYKTDTFPSDEFHFILSHEEYYIIFMDWFSEKLEEKLNQHPEILLSVNFCLDQFQYIGSNQFLERFKSYSENILIEITEHFPTRNPELLDSLPDILKKIKQYNYKIVIDDFTEGINTYFLYKKYRSYYNRIKITYRNNVLSWLNIVFLAYYVRPINKIYFKEISIVVEKIDTVNKAKWMRKFGLYRQQGYLLGKRLRKD